MAVGGERGGKSIMSAADLATRLPWGSLYWLIGPDYYQPRAEFEYLQSFLWALGAIRSTRDVQTPKEGSWKLETKSGQRIETRTSADVRKLATKAVDGIILCEAGQQSYDTFLKAIGRTSQTRGFVLASGTFESSYGWYASTFSEWFSAKAAGEEPEGEAFSIPTWENVYEFPGGREDPEILRLEQLYAGIPGYFEEKCGAKPAPPLGTIFRIFSYRVHVSDLIKFDLRLPVYLAIDPGHGGASPYAIAACQFHPGTGGSDVIDFCHVIDVMYLPGADFEDIYPLVQDRPWFRAVAGGAIDVEAPDERKRWRRILGINLAAKKVPVLEGERRLQTFLYHSKERPPHLMFSSNIPAAALREFAQYKSLITKATEFEARSSSAAKRRSGPEHMLKALWYLLYIRYGPVHGSGLPAPFVRTPWAKLARAAGLRRFVE